MKLIFLYQGIGHFATSFVVKFLLQQLRKSRGKRHFVLLQNFVVTITVTTTMIITTTFAASFTPIFTAT
jgi:hypothetical protein